MLLAPVLGAVLAASWVTPAGAATVPPLRSVGGGDCPTVVAAGADATVIAAECGRDVEVLAERTEWNTVYAQPDGSMRLEASIAAVRSQVTGEWTEIDTSLVATGEGIAVVAPAVEMVFSDGAPGQPLAWMRRDGHELTFDVPFDLGAPVVHGSMLEYRDVLDGVDLIVTVNADGTGFTEVLRVASPQAAADPRIAELIFPVQVSDGLVLAESEGGFAATDAAGERVFGAPPPAMWDSSADLAAPMLTPGVGGLAPMASDSAVPSEGIVANRVARTEAPLEGDRTAVMDLGVDDDAVVVTPDRDILSDPGTVWPVYIDPSVSGSRSAWVSVRNDGWTDYNYTGDQGVGLCGTTGSPMYCSKVFTRRAAWQFTGLQAIGNVDPGDVVSATLSVYGTHSYSCTAYPVEAWWTGGIGSGTNWSNLSWLGLQSTQGVAHKSDCGNQRWIEFPVIGGAQQTAAQNAAQLTVGLKAQNESSSTGWKRYRYDATLSVVYNRAPATPTNPYMTNSASSGSLGCGASGSAPTYVNTLTPFMWATISDPDGGNVMAWFDVYRSGSLVWDGGQTAAQASGRQHNRQIPSGVLSEGLAYEWNIFGYDGARHSVSGRICHFVVDRTPPGAPTITAVSGGDALYPAGVESGGPGATGRFQFSSASGDVVRFDYSVNSTAFNLSVPVGSPVAAYTPPGAGWYTLHVRSVDRAGNTSAASYEFGVAAAGTSVWLLEQSTVDSGSGGDRRPLTVQGAPAWVPGPLTESGGQDWAIELDGVDDALVAAAPATVAGRSFSVSAIVRTADAQGSSAAVGEEASGGLGFALGQLSDPLACPDGVAPCWAFMMPTAGSGTAVATSGVPVVADTWVQLTGVYDATAGTAVLHVCPLWDERTSGSVVTASGSGLGVGPFSVGRAGSGGALMPWAGAVAEVRFYDVALEGESGEDEIQQTCYPGL